MKNTYEKRAEQSREEKKREDKIREDTAAIPASTVSSAYSIGLRCFWRLVFGYVLVDFGC